MVLSLAALALITLAAAETAERPLHVAIMSLPSRVEPHRDTAKLAKQLVARLGDAGFRVTEAGVSESVPAVEAAAIATQSGADFVIGVRATSSCPVLLLPPAAAEPKQSQPVHAQEALAAIVRQTVGASRYKYSATAAKALEDSVRWCAGRPDEVEAYILSAVQSPVVLLRLSSGSASLAFKAVPNALRTAARSARP